MILEIIFLLISTWAGILCVFVMPNIQTRNFGAILTFSGAYLFAITVIHILPELYQHAKQPFVLGVCVLGGFYMQIFINYFSTGVDHGHIHGHHSHASSEAVLLFISIWIHSLLEGTLLVHPQAAHPHDETGNLLVGIILHKVPESIALASILLSHLSSKKWIWVMLFIYSIATPAGMYLSNSMMQYQWMNDQWVMYIFAIVAGNFLHISTTIFFESEQNKHRFSLYKMLLIISAALIACGVEFIG
ncbi:MAG: ZIP family metal transporter [Cytophagales bacterium]|nr:ZIP family metal transporter [Cytophagales bacterium]